MNVVVYVGVLCDSVVKLSVCLRDDVRLLSAEMMIVWL